MATKRRRLERHGGVTEALAPPPRPRMSPSVSFRMEDLPEEIQHLVLSLLPLKEAARTSLVSRSWRKLWTRYPNLCFDGSKYASADMDSVKIERSKFTETVNSVIQQHSGMGLNKFSVRYSLRMDSSDVLNRWIFFATASKAKTIDVNLLARGNYVWPTKQAHHFPLEALGAHDRPFVQCLFLTNVSIKLHLGMPGFAKLRSLHLHCIQVIGDLSGLLRNCSALEDLEVIACSGVTDLNIPHQLDKLRNLLIFHMRIQMVELHVPNLSHFGYKGGTAIPIVLHGCSKLQKATLNFYQTWLEEDNNKVLGHVFHGIPSVSAVKKLHVYANMRTKHPVWSPQMLYYASVSRCWRGEGVSYCMRRHDHLKTVYMSGFRCHRAQVELLYGILETGSVLEHVTIEPMVRIQCSLESMNLGIPRDEICEWAHRTSQRFGKAITVAECPQQQC